jgi:NAD(P)H-nitrite reductase large subunit
MAGIEKIKYLIMGNSAGGIGAAEAIREVDRAGAITIISDEPYPAYSRPLISEYLANPCSLNRLLFRPPDFYERNGIKTLFGERVVQVNPDEHTVRLEGGRTLGWQKLLLATGGSPMVPGIEGVGLRGVFTFNKLDDARAIDDFLKRYRRKISAVVIGGGLIGVSVTEALVERGVGVTIVEMKERILNTILDEEASTLEAEALTQAGVRIITGHTVNGIASYLPGKATGVSLDDSRPIPCELVIIAIGVQPCLGLASGGGIKTNRGIVVDRHMATSSDGVYACGDVAEAYDFVLGENRLTPVWPNACMGGRVAGLNMAGIPAEYQGGTSMNAMKYFGVNMVSAGTVNPPDNSYEIVSERHNGIFKKVIIKDGRVVGLVFAGDIEKSGIVYNLMKDRVDVSSFKEALVADDFGLASLPEEIWQARLAVPPPELTSLVTPAGEPEEAFVGE